MRHPHAIAHRSTAAKRWVEDVGADHDGGHDHRRTESSPNEVTEHLAEFGLGYALGHTFVTNVYRISLVHNPVQWHERVDRALAFAAEL